MGSMLENLAGSLLSNEGISALAGKTGVDSAQIQNVVKNALPVLMQSMTNNAKSEQGASSLASALKSHAQDGGSVTDQIKNANTADGAKILGHLLGGNNRTVQSKLAESTGISASQVTSILSSITPALMSSVGKETQKSSGTDLSGVLSSLTGGKSGGLGGIMEFINQDKDGDGKSDLLSSLSGLFSGNKEK